MDPRDYFLAYIENCGGRTQASRRLGIPYATIAAVCNGTRGIGKELAARMAQGSGGLLDPNRLIWVRPIRRDGEAA